MMTGSAEPLRLAPVLDADKMYAILTAIEALTDSDLVQQGAWDPMDEISSATIFDAIEGTPEGVFETNDGKFEATATVYVTLQYGGSRDSVSMSDSYPALVKGHFDEKGKVDIDSVEIDNSSFYSDGNE